ncbi:ribosomal protein S18 acetylase RimI-like enzyme [Kribbella aluminosa]|uniref:Ribosomal protein S18 acetylase RimI-like enzyme n=1 Tax=Kribbella aluminosa TaxID=416017 RepID=A0ABS4UXB1_9ACTN|nr:GNAT family N-acetyltransferase [Kribbella aluminosa]MBP2356252.1 ribosomal protein S18 acetylase RimI-like enzyme [Kribbella aluminosa]
MTTEWHRATAADAEFLAGLAAVGVAEVAAFLRSWRVHITATNDAAVAVLPPADGQRRGYGAWWVRGGSDEAAAQLVRLARATPGVRVLQIALPADEIVDDPPFERAFSVWTMVHDGISWPEREPELAAPLRYCGPGDVLQDEFQHAYEQAYRDQRLVEPRTLWDRLPDQGALAVTPDGRVAGFVLGFSQADGSVELGPIGTVPGWRGRGVCTALLGSVLLRSRGLQLHLTVDGESPTGAQELYLRHGFRITARLVRYEVQLS